jgi:transcriptional regulator with XRE-family HTH domain
VASKTAFRIYSSSSIGSAIRHYRKKAGLTQSELADQTGISRSYLTRLESGRETEQLRRILRIFRRLGVSVSVEEADRA